MPSTLFNRINYNFVVAALVTSSMISVGKAGADWQLTHIAAGRLSDISTDGINSGQLFATDTEVNKLSTKMANIKQRSVILTRVIGEYYRINSSGVDDSASVTDLLAMRAEAISSGNNALAIGYGARCKRMTGLFLFRGFKQ